MLNMSLKEIKGKIQIHPEVWVNMYTTNCYAFALGLDVKESDICLNAYQPGKMSGFYNLDANEYFDYNTLIEAIENDFDFLNIKYRKINPNDEIASDEWKIALFLEKYHGILTNYHFLRQYQNGIWFHKDGFNTVISKKDYLGRTITNPYTSELTPYTYDKCYALRINK